MNEGKLLKAAEAAELLQVSLYTIYGWTSSRRIPFRKVGNLLRFDRAELEAWSRRDPINREIAFNLSASPSGDRVVS